MRFPFLPREEKFFDLFVEDAQKAVDAVKGLSWMSPRGPVSIDPETRHITQNIYLREVVKGPDGKTFNKEIKTFPDQKDPGLATQ